MREKLKLVHINKSRKQKENLLPLCDKSGTAQPQLNKNACIFDSFVVV